MPLGKYSCDYCGKEFQDTPHARRRHLTGVQHQRAKALWYNSFQPDTPGAKALWYNSFHHLQPDTPGACNHFLRTGTCKYGDACKYFHPHQNAGLNFVTTASPPNALGNQLLDASSLSGNVVRDQIGVSWGNLPPSLRPPPEGGYPPMPFVDWG